MPKPIIFAESVWLFDNTSAPGITNTLANVATRVTLPVEVVDANTEALSCTLARLLPLNPVTGIVAITFETLENHDGLTVVNEFPLFTE